MSEQNGDNFRINYRVIRPEMSKLDKILITGGTLLTLGSIGTQLFYEMNHQPNSYDLSLIAWGGALFGLGMIGATGYRVLGGPFTSTRRSEDREEIKID